MKTITAVTVSFIMSGSAAWANESHPANDTTRTNATDSSLRVQVTRPDNTPDNKPADTAAKKEDVSGPRLSQLKIHGI